MKKYAVLFLVMALSGAYAAPAAAIDTNDISLIKLDTDSRSAKSGGSIMLKRNADQYRQLSNEEKAEIERRRRAEAEYRRMQEEQMRRQAQREAMRRAQEEAERQRAAALKPITLYGNKLKIYALVNGDVPLMFLLLSFLSYLLRPLAEKIAGVWLSNAMKGFSFALGLGAVVLAFL